MRIFRKCGVGTIAAGLFVVLATLATASGPARATLIDNGSSTIDTATGYEWLDLTLTAGQSYNSVVLGGFGGYVAAGYTVATTAQLCGLFGALGDAIANCGAGGSQTDLLSPASASEFIAKLGSTWSGGGTFGWFDGGAIGGNAVALGCINGANVGCIAGPANNASTLVPNWVGLSGSNTVVGAWLVRTAEVPEPGALAVFGLGLVGMGVVRRRGKTRA